VTQLGPRIRKYFDGESLIGSSPNEVELPERVPGSTRIPSTPPLKSADDRPGSKMAVNCGRLAKQQRKLDSLVKHEIAHSKEIGFVASNIEGKPYILWMKWWDAPRALQPVLRFLSRGQSWYMFNRDSKYHGSDIFCGNQVSFRGLARWRKKVLTDGLIIRKEDRGKRFVIFESTLELEWFRSEANRRGLTPIQKPMTEDEAQLPTAKIYFLPKAHKPVLSGRLIENCRKINPRSLDKAILKALAPWNYRDVSKAVQSVSSNIGTSGLQIFSGDVEKLFPSIPQSELITLIRAKIGFQTANKVKQMLNAYRLTFQSVSYQVTLGLPIGHPWSPALAEFYLSCKEEKFVSTLPQGVKFARYADDTIFAAKPQLVSSIQSNYRKAVHPLKVEWEILPLKAMKFKDQVVQHSLNTDEGSYTVLDEIPDRMKFLDATFHTFLSDEDCEHMLINNIPMDRKLFLPAYHDKMYGIVNGELPPSIIVQSIIGKLLRVAQIEFSSSHVKDKLDPRSIEWAKVAKWHIGLRLLNGVQKSSNWDNVLKMIDKSGLNHHMKAVKRSFLRHTSTTMLTDDSERLKVAKPTLTWQLKHSLDPPGPAIGPLPNVLTDSIDNPSNSENCTMRYIGDTIEVINIFGQRCFSGTIEHYRLWQSAIMAEKVESIIRLKWHPYWSTAAGAKQLAQLRKLHHVRWDMEYVRSIGRLARV